MTKSTERLNHALHNETVCDYLDLKPEFADWIITTAFYSSLHFVSHRIFPFEVPAIGGKKTTIHNIDEYSRYNNSKKLTKHELLKNLVGKNCSDIEADYSWLLDMSMNSRYQNYNHDIRVARKAKSLMGIIKKKCT